MTKFIRNGFFLQNTGDSRLLKRIKKLRPHEQFFFCLFMEVTGSDWTEAKVGIQTTEIVLHTCWYFAPLIGRHTELNQIVLV